MPKTITVLSESKSYSNRAFEVVDQMIELPNGVRTQHSTVLHNGAVVILPLLDDGRLVLLRQYRHAIQRTLLEFPAGTLTKGELPRSCAEREIAEETGFGARRWVDLGVMYPAPGFCNEVQFAYFAAELYPRSLEGDEDEIIEVVHLSIGEVEAAIRAGDLCDCKSIAIFYKSKLAGLI